MEVSRNHNSHKIRSRFFYHLLVICIPSHVKTVDRFLQMRFICLCHTHQLHLFPTEIPQYTDMIHSHRACPDNTNFQSHRASTSCAIVARSSALSAGWTGNESTCCAIISVTGKCKSGCACVDSVRPASLTQT